MGDEVAEKLFVHEAEGGGGGGYEYEYELYYSLTAFCGT